MKLALKSRSGVEVLTGTGDFSARDLQIVRAGITRLLTTGKHRIVFEIPQADKLPPEILRELSLLDLMARELSGRVVLAGHSELLRSQIQRFAQPPVISCFDSLEAALKHFEPAPPAKPAIAPAAASDPQAGPAPALMPAAAPGPGDVATAKSAIRQQEVSQLTELRTRLARAENENQLLKDQLLAALQQRRVPPSNEAARQKIEALEQKIEELLGTAATAKK